MKDAIIIGALAALTTGVTIAIQATLTSRAGALIGDVKTGLMTNLLGGTLAGIIILIFIFVQGTSFIKIPSAAFAMVAVGGALGVVIIMGVSFSLQRAGVAAGLATIILGQMLISTIVDTRGIGGAEPIPFTLQRAAGILIMGIAVYLILPRS